MLVLAGRWWLRRGKASGDHCRGRPVRGQTWLLFAGAVAEEIASDEVVQVERHLLRVQVSDFVAAEAHLTAMLLLLLLLMRGKVQLGLFGRSRGQVVESRRLHAKVQAW